MIKLANLIFEASQRPKAVVMAGGAGAGKSYLIDKLGLISLPMFNPDKYVEDPQHPYHNNLSAASGQVDKDVQAAAETGKSLGTLQHLTQLRYRTLLTKGMMYIW